MRWICLGIVALTWTASVSGEEPASPWKAGVAAQVITPKKNVWLAGYAKRNTVSAGKVQDLFAKALALEDQDGKRVVILTLDLIGITRAMREDVARQAEQKWGLSRDRLLVNASHTHCSPLVRGRPSVMFELTEQQWADVDEYLAALPALLVQVIGKSLKDLAPAQLSYTHARAGFAMNRRLPTSKGYQNSPYPDGPVDHDVPVLRVEDPKGKLRALLFGYACHNTTLQFEYLCGDYAGYAQEYLEADHPGVTALFMAGCGGDQNPFPRSTLARAKQHGRALANAVEAALLPRPRPVSGPLKVAFEETTLQFMPLSRDTLVQMGMSKTIYEVRRSKLLLAELEKNGQLRSRHAYPIQVLQFGKDLTLVALAGETVVDFSLRLKKEIAGNPLWVAGYCNDVFGYVPSVRVQKEGGYEPVGSTQYSILPGPLAQSTEERIISKVTELVQRVRKR